MEKYLKTSLCIIIIFVFSSLSQAEIYDLGTLEVDGEVRRPKVQFFQPEKVSDKSVKLIAEKKLNDLETLILNNLSAPKDKQKVSGNEKR